MTHTEKQVKKTKAMAHWHSQTGNRGTHAVYHLVEAV